MNSELGRRVGFTVGALLVYRLGSQIPLPGIDASALAALFHRQPAGAFGALDLFAGGGVHRLAIFALGLLPYITAAVLIQVVMLFTPRLRPLLRSGEAGRNRIVSYTLYLTLALAVFQSYGVAHGLEGVRGLVPAPGWLFRLSTVATLTCGTLFLVWLSNQITLRGVGNGLTLILLVGIVVEVPRTIVTTLEPGQRGVVSASVIVAVALVAVALTLLIVLMELGRRRLPLEFAARQVGGRAALSFKLNGAGVIPTIIASWFLVVPAIIATLMSGAETSWWAVAARQLVPGHLMHMIVYPALIVLFAYLYTALILDPDQAAGDLERYGGALPGVAAGEPTAVYLDKVISRITLLGALYLALVYLIPEILVAALHVPFYLGGASLLIVVCASIDVYARFRGQTAIALGD